MYKKLMFLAMFLALGLSFADAQGERQVWVYFFGWYTDDSWNDPRLIDRPIGRYRSYDDGRIGDQIALAQDMGVDAFIHTWLGRGENNLTDIVLNKALNQASWRGFKIGASVDLVNDGWLLTEEATTRELQYLMQSVVVHPAYLRYNGKPVIYFWNQQRFPVATWANIREQVDPNRSTIWISEGVSTHYLGVFDGLYQFNTAWSPNPGATAQQFAALTRGAGGELYTPTVMPGWDEERVIESQNRTNPTDPQERQGGRFLHQSWVGATQANTDVILIVSWNEYFENSHIEPSELHGWTAIDTLRPLIAAWKSGAPPPPPPAPPPQEPEEAAPPPSPEGEQQATALAPPAGAPTGVKFTAGYLLNMRAGPSTDAAIVGTVPFDSVLDVVGRTSNSAWIQVNHNGSSGWVSLQLGTITEGDMMFVPVVTP